MEKVRWGIIGTAKIATNHVIPAMQAGRYSLISGIASRSIARAKETAGKFGIPLVFGSYEDLLSSSEIDAVYIPLPNHLHADWSIKAIEAGKHVLCEKPISVNSLGAENLLAVAHKHPRIKIMEAFMYRFHLQWQYAKKLVVEGKIGRLRTIQTCFSYHNTDPNNIRNISEYGGGSLLDLGCYCISLSRFIFSDEPVRVLGIIEYDPKFKIDRLTSGILEFREGTATFTCATQLASYQRVRIFGTEGWIEIEIPFNAPSDKPCRLWHAYQNDINEINFEICNQYTIQGDAMSKAILDDMPVPTDLDDAVVNMKVIDAVIHSANNRIWIEEDNF
jgi:predicted dehydrogenase